MTSCVQGHDRSIDHQTNQKVTVGFIKEFELFEEVYRSVSSCLQTARTSWGAGAS